MWLANERYDNILSQITDLRTRLEAVNPSKALETLDRVESLERRFAELHALLTTTTPTGRPRLTDSGKRVQTFMFGGVSPGYVPPAAEH